MLKNTIKEIEEWSAKNNITIFYGHIDEEGLNSIVNWHSKKNNKYISYLETAKKLDVSLIILHEIKNDFDSEDEEIILLKEKLEEEELKEFNEKLKKVQPYKGEVAIYNIVFIKDNVFFTFSEDAKWSNIFDDLIEFIGEHNFKDDDSEENDFRDNRFGTSLSKTEKKEFSKQLAENEEFQQCKNRSQRHYVASKVFAEKEELINDTWLMQEIINNADCIVKLEIEPKKQKDLKEKIKVLFSQGLSESEISEKLGLTNEKLRKIYTTPIRQKIRVYPKDI